jgi:ectoine hydroxylase-related dioxygenase (phytanoyl-CoA dioxygenase family)
MITQEVSELKNNGYVILKERISYELLNKLITAVDKAFIEHKKIQIENNSDIKSDGVALHALLSDNTFIELLQQLLDKGFIQELQDCYFDSKCILNSLSALNNLANQPNFSAVVHRDLRFYSGDFPMMLNCLLMLDDFTIENGGTYLLPKSHLDERKPSDEEFFNNAIQATGKKGDILIFNANVWHAAAPNTTQEGRRAIPITISKPFMKQLLDYPRALGYDKINTFSEELQELLGYHSRVPASLVEWYQPKENRFYKKNQD